MALRKRKAKRKTSVTEVPPGARKISKKKPKTRKVRCMRIGDIQVVGERRAVDADKVRVIAQSLAVIGLKNPITVSSGWGKSKLLTGLHRLEAAKSLGWEYIDAFTMNGNATGARLWEIAENLHRADLTILERAELTVKWERLIDQKGVQVEQPSAGGEQPHDKGISKAARELGLSREKIRRAREIAKISAETKAAARDAGLDDNQTALIEIADEEKGEAQLKKIKEITRRIGRRDDRKKRAVEASTGQESKTQPDEHPADETIFAEIKVACPMEFRKLFKRAPENVRRRFLREFLGWEGGRPAAKH